MPMRKTCFFIIVFLVSFVCFAGHPVKTSFTDFETRHIRVKTPGLFAESNSFTIHLDQISDSEFSFPLPDGHVISHFGGARRHGGTDIKTKANDTIRCVFSGVVRLSRVYGGYGNVIVVRHPNGLESVYGHNSKNIVKQGDVVKAGQALALTGRTGRATTEHLHFEFRVDGVAFNPNLVFNFKTNTLNHGDLVCTKQGNSVKVKHINN
jgi:murein DD-endopeptidase MepM/ murein hydrolase activator NlpD